MALAFVVFLEGQGYEIEFVPDFFFAEATSPVTGDVIVVADVRNFLAPANVNVVRGVSSETKVLLVDLRENPDYATSIWPAISSAVGAFVYDVEEGWISTPDSHDTEALRRNLMQKDARITVVDDEIHKICTKCGSILPLSEYYLKPRVRRGGLDPYRNYCKSCAKEGA